MLSDLAPLEMSAPEPADARLSGVGSAQTPLRLAQLLPVRSRQDDAYETRQAAEMNRALAPRSRPIPPYFCHTSYACFSFRRSASATVQLLLRLKRTSAALVPDVQGARQSPCTMMMWAKAETGARLSDPLLLW